jgi:hypothetical protein
VVNAGVVVEAFELGGAGELKQVAVAGIIFSQQQHMARLLVFLRVVFPDGAGCHVGFQPDDRVDTSLDGGVVELDHPEHGAVVGYGEPRHPQCVGALNQLVDIAEAIKQRVFGVNVKMYEGHGLE